MSAYTYGTSALKIEKQEPRKRIRRGTAKKVNKKYVRSNFLSILVMTQTARFSLDPNPDPNAETRGKGWMKTIGAIGMKSHNIFPRGQDFRSSLLMPFSYLFHL